jgi:beta-galactosidase
VKTQDGITYIGKIEPSEKVAIRIRAANGKETQIIVLSRESARNLWKAPIAGRDRLFLSSAESFFDGDQLHLRATNPSELAFGVFPGAMHNPTGFAASGHDGVFDLYSAHIKPVSVNAQVDKLKDAGLRPPVDMGKEVAQAPSDSAFSAAAEWSVRIPPVDSHAVKNLFLRVTYEGDMARVYDHGKLITDDFFHGSPWEIGLSTILAHDADPDLRLSILPLRKDAPIYLPTGTHPEFATGGQVARILKIQVVPEYEAIAGLAP